MLLPNGIPMRVTRLLFVMVALAAGVVLALRSSGAKPGAVQAADGRLEAAQLERQAVAARAEVVTARAAEARSATRPAIAHMESLHARVKVEHSGLLSVNDGGAAEATLVPVPPLVTERMQADSVAINALSVAMTEDVRAAAAQEERLVAEAKVRDAAGLTIAALEHERRPRCGRRCGMVLGAASVIALGIVVDQTRRLFR
jgi:hypothetical protein